MCFVSVQPSPEFVMTLYEHVRERGVLIFVPELIHLTSKVIYTHASKDDCSAIKLKCIQAFYLFKLKLLLRRLLELGIIHALFFYNNQGQDISFLKAVLMVKKAPFSST